MPKFVIHKKGFFYTDEAFEAHPEAKGSIVNTFGSLDTATAAKAAYDVASMQNLKGTNAIDFLFSHKNYDGAFQQLEAFYKKDFGITLTDKYYFNFPPHISRDQAKVFLSILEISFHDIVEYPDDAVLNPDDFKLDHMELGEF
ncbi:hypothetical protein [Paraflavitalea sp. CAU 1676]|uniref:hypothetical protein n=1 Tax=Paraflavitalea sp. CAU 1676 TaxID=3032598 RepID=UPI0023DB39EF|nr:hypothetical protein [Paraflavitalea sp. CAU 1676]MDF2192875.1 hypothetical protein [Paraflavitalea sp. CAU 1676]